MCVCVCVCVCVYHIFFIHYSVNGHLGRDLILFNKVHWFRFFKNLFCCEYISSVQFSCSVVSNSLQPCGLQHVRSPCPSPASGAYSNSCPSRQWCHPTISSSVVPFIEHSLSLFIERYMDLFYYGGLLMDREAWHAAVRGITKSQTWLSDWLKWNHLQWYRLDRLITDSSKHWQKTENRRMIMSMCREKTAFKLKIPSIFTFTW